jgi:hypothetical protein
MILSARYANPQATAAIAITDKNGAIVVSKMDTPEAWAEMLAWGTPETYIEPIIPVPTTVTPLQARKVLRIAGFKEQVEAYIATLSEEAREEWEYCIEVRRDNPTVLAAATALNLTKTQIDELFVLGATL